MFSELCWAVYLPDWFSNYFTLYEYNDLLLKMDWKLNILTQRSSQIYQNFLHDILSFPVI